MVQPSLGFTLPVVQPEGSRAAAHSVMWAGLSRLASLGCASPNTPRGTTNEKKSLGTCSPCCSPRSSSEPAKAQSLDELDKREAAVIEARKATPLTVRHC